MTRFPECLAHVLLFEGGYSNHPNDRGGATNQGITQSTYDGYQDSLGLPHSDVKYITGEEVAEIYRRNYWDACQCDDMPPRVDLCVFDSSVQHGPRRAIRWLQRAVGSTEDGVCGPRTLYMLSDQVLRGRISEVIQSYIKFRSAFYLTIIANDPSQQVFARGWNNRVRALQAAVTGR